MRWLVLALGIASCDQGEPRPLPTYGANAFIEVLQVTVTDMDVPPDRRRIRISGDGAVEDVRDVQGTFPVQQDIRHRTVSPHRFAELVQELLRADVLTLSRCIEIDHGRHTTFTLSVPEGHPRINLLLEVGGLAKFGASDKCDALRVSIRHIMKLAD